MTAYLIKQANAALEETLRREHAERVAACLDAWVRNTPLVK